MATLRERLDNKEVIILDGGMGTELQRRGVPMDHAAWCGAAVKTHPEVVRQVHRDYIDAGADVIIANTFATARHVLEAAGLGDEVAAITRRAVELAREARDASAKRPVWVAGSLSTMPPKDDHALSPTPERAREIYREHAALLAEAGVDLVALEMMMDLEEAPIAVEAAVATGLPVWVGFSCRIRDDGSVRMWKEPTARRDIDPEFGEVADEILRIGGEVAGVMHSDVEDTASALRVLREHWDGPLSAYAETGGFEMPNWDFVGALEPDAYAERAREWVEMGVQVVGGCCGTGVEHIRRLRERLPQRL